MIDPPDHWDLEGGEDFPFEDDPDYGDDLDHLISNAGLPPVEECRLLPCTETLDRAKRMIVTGQWTPEPDNRLGAHDDLDGSDEDA